MTSIMENMHMMKNRTKDYYLLLLADFISSLGAASTSIALTLDIYGSTQNLMASAMFAVLMVLPQLIISPFITKINFKLSFRTMFVIGELLCAFQLLAIMLLNRLTIIYIMYFLFSAVFFVIECIRAEYLKLITLNEDMQKRQSISRFVNTAVSVIGPIVGGYIITVRGIELVYLFGILLYILAACIIFHIDGSDFPMKIDVDHSLADRMVKVCSANWDIIVGSLLITFVGGATSILTLEYIYGILSADALQYSVLMTALSIGSLLGSIIGGLSFMKKSQRIVSLCSTICMGLLLLSVLLKPGFYILIGIMTISGILSALVMVFYSTELFLRSDSEQIRGNYVLFQNVVDISEAASQPFGALINRLIGCIYSMASMGLLFIISAISLFFKEKENT